MELCRHRLQERARWNVARRVVGQADGTAGVAAARCAFHFVLQETTWDANHTVLFSMSCGSISDFYEGSDCIKQLLPSIKSCEIYHVLPNIPFYGATFSRGTPLFSAMIGSIRQRLGVAVKPSGDLCIWH